MKWKHFFAKSALKDAWKFSSAGLREKVELFLAILAENPFQNPPPYEKLAGDLTGACSRRINIQHRLVCIVCEDSWTVRVQRMWSHYE